MSMRKEIIPSNTEAGRALKVITRLQITTVIIVIVLVVIDVLLVSFRGASASAAFPGLSMIVMPIGFGIIFLSLIVEIPIIILALIKKRK